VALVRVVVAGDVHVHAARNEQRPDVFLQRQRDTHVAGVARVVVVGDDRGAVPPVKRIHQNGPVRDRDHERRLGAVQFLIGKRRLQKRVLR
jgi:hypothetical protein